MYHVVVVVLVVVGTPFFAFVTLQKKFIFALHLRCMCERDEQIAKDEKKTAAS
jgi:hypothetical protein